MTDKKPKPTNPPSSVADSRRQALKAAGVVAGIGALPTQWKKPVAKSMVLPVHAEMSVPPACFDECDAWTPDCPDEFQPFFINAPDGTPMDIPPSCEPF